MTTVTSKPGLLMPFKNLLLLSILCSLISGCGADSKETNGSETSIKESVNTTKAKAWKGVAEGYVSTGLPSTDRIELFVRIGNLLSAAHEYRNRAEAALSERNPNEEQINAAHEYVAAAFSDELVRSTLAIEPVIQAKMQEVSQEFGLHGLLLELVNEQQISDLINGDRAQRDKQSAARQKIMALYGRVHAAVLAFFPSRREYLLASSALIRHAGDKIAVGVSENGVILDVDLVRQASTLIYRSMKLNPKNVSFCESQRLAVSTHKDSINRLLDQMVPLKLGEKISITASDVYGLAKQAQTAGQGLPVTDSQKCN